MSKPISCLMAIGVLLGMVLFVAMVVLLLSTEFWAVFDAEAVQRGITNPGKNWQEWIAWVFRVPGVAIALLTVAIPWLTALARRGPSPPIPRARVVRPPSDLPAAAVSVLETREVKSRTLLTILVEMGQRGSLMITGVRQEPRPSEMYWVWKGDYTYRLSVRGKPRFDWERTACDAIPQWPATVSTLGFMLEEQAGVIGEQLGAYLQGRGLFDDNPLMKSNFPVWAVRLAWLGMLLLVVGLAVWMMELEGGWEMKVAAGVLTGVVAGGVYVFGAEMAHRQIVRLSRTRPTEDGLYEIGRWLSFREHLVLLSPSAGHESTGWAAAIRCCARRRDAVAAPRGRSPAVVRSYQHPVGERASAQP